MSVVFSIGSHIRKNRPLPRGQLDGGFSLKGDNASIVILVHGLTGTPNEMRFLANYLNKKGYSVICPRLANHGEPIWILKKTRWQEFYRSVKSVVESDEVMECPGRVFVSGLSMGALLSLMIAHDYKDRIAGVSCLAPTLFYDGWNTPLAKYFMPLAMTPLKHLFYFKEEPPYGVMNEAIQQRIHKYYHTATLDDMENVSQYGYPYFPVTLLYQLQLLVRNLKARLPGVEAPVQLIQAKDDDMTSTRNSRYIYDRVSSKVKEMIFLYNSYHVITVDHERDVVAQKMEAFFNNIQSRQALQEYIAPRPQGFK